MKKVILPVLMSLTIGGSALAATTGDSIPVRYKVKIERDSNIKETARSVLNLEAGKETTVIHAQHAIRILAEAQDDGNFLIQTEVKDRDTDEIVTNSQVIVREGEQATIDSRSTDGENPSRVELTIAVLTNYGKISSDMSPVQRIEATKRERFRR